MRVEEKREKERGKSDLMMTGIITFTIIEDEGDVSVNILSFNTCRLSLFPCRRSLPGRKKSRISSGRSLTIDLQIGRNQFRVGDIYMYLSCEKKRKGIRRNHCRSISVDDENLWTNKSWLSTFVDIQWRREQGRRSCPWPWSLSFLTISPYCYHSSSSCYCLCLDVHNDIRKETMT